MWQYTYCHLLHTSNEPSSLSLVWLLRISEKEENKGIEERTRKYAKGISSYYHPLIVSMPSNGQTSL